MRSLRQTLLLHAALCGGGVAVALGVMLDTMIVRSVLVTALNLDLGGRMWWPSKLDSADVPLTEAEAAAPLETVH